MAVTVIVAQYMLAFVLAGHSTEAALTELGTWSPLLGVLGLLAVQALGCVAIVRYFLVHAGPDFRAWATLIAPILGGLAMAGGVTLLMLNRDALSGVGDAGFVLAMPCDPGAVRGGGGRRAGAPVPGTGPGTTASGASRVFATEPADQGAAPRLITERAFWPEAPLSWRQRADAIRTQVAP
jgi:hypothetical protein